MALYFSYRALLALIFYGSLSSGAFARISSWQVEEVSGKFPICANFSFDFREKSYNGRWVFSEPLHLNEPSAVGAIKEMARQSWVVFFSPNNPSQSALEREFPKGLCLRAFLCYAVLAYFVFLFKKIYNTV